MPKKYFLRQNIDLTDCKPMFINLENNNQFIMHVWTIGRNGYVKFNNVGDEVNYESIKLYHTYWQVKYSLELTKTKEQEVQTFDNVANNEEASTYKSNIVEENENSVFSHHKSSTNILNNALEAAEYFDVTFLTKDDKKVSGHRFILYKQSERFTSLFKENQESQNEIKVDFPFEIFSRAIKFCYGKVDAVAGYELELILFAEEFKINGLREACLHSLSNLALAAENICGAIKIACDENMKDFKARCIQFLKENKNGIEKQVFDSLPHEVLVEIIVTI
uniref:BTB domain-containing protein n=1 Tax=Panagrolaimus davidi TaxID=227884 RepID=A0A914QJE4_9BILA